jgi:hypothetical protein
MKLLYTARVSAAAGVMVRELEGESVLLNLNSESYFGLDEIGTRMWTLLTNSNSIQSAYENLLTEYEVEPEKLSRDLDDLIEKLVAHGLAEVAGG